VAVPVCPVPVAAGLATAATEGVVAAEVTGAGVDEAVVRAAREAETGSLPASRGLVGWRLAGLAGFFDGGESTVGSSVKPPELRPAVADSDLGSAPGAVDGAVTAVDWFDAVPSLFPAPKNITSASSGLVSSPNGFGVFAGAITEGLPASLVVFFSSSSSSSSSDVKLTGVTVVASSGNSN
jgi:hypothetical protein